MEKWCRIPNQAYVNKICKELAPHYLFEANMNSDQLVPGKFTGGAILARMDPAVETKRSLTHQDPNGRGLVVSLERRGSPCHSGWHQDAPLHCKEYIHRWCYHLQCIYPNSRTHGQELYIWSRFNTLQFVQFMVAGILAATFCGGGRNALFCTWYTLANNQSRVPPSHSHTAAASRATPVGTTMHQCTAKNISTDGASTCIVSIPTVAAKPAASGDVIG